MRYTVNSGHGMLPEAVHEGEATTRGEAQRLAVALISSGKARAVEVRCDYALLDSYVLRGASARHIFAAKQREGQRQDLFS